MIHESVSLKFFLRVKSKTKNGVDEMYGIMYNKNYHKHNAIGISGHHYKELDIKHHLLEEDGDVVVKRWHGNALNRRPRATNIN